MKCNCANNWARCAIFGPALLYATMYAIVSIKATAPSTLSLTSCSEWRETWNRRMTRRRRARSTTSESVDLFDSLTGGHEREEDAVPVSLVGQQGEDWYATHLGTALRLARIFAKAIWIKASTTSPSTLDETSPRGTVRSESPFGRKSISLISTTQI